MFIDSSAFTAPAAMFVKIEVEKCSFDQTKIESSYEATVNTVREYSLSSSRHRLSRSAIHLKNLSYEQKNSFRDCSDFSSTEDQKSFRKIVNNQRESSKKSDRH